LTRLKLSTSIFSLSAIALIVLLFLGLQQQNKSSLTSLDLEKRQGADAPAFTGLILKTDIDSQKTLSLESTRGQHILLSFRASWCAPCKREAVMMEKIYPAYKNKNYEFIGINIWEPTSDAKKFAARFPVSFPVLIDEDRRIHIDYGITRLPTILLLTPDLRIFKRYEGELSEQSLHTLLRELEVYSRLN